MEKIKDEGSMHKCAHVPCRCLILSTQEYCSAYCSDADDVEITEFQCDCGHGNCVLNCACGPYAFVTQVTRLPERD